MKWLDRLRARPEPATRPVGLSTHPITVNPSGPQELEFAVYRIGAICRDREQRVAEGRDRHREHDAMTAEARMYAAMLLRAGRIDEAGYQAVEWRLNGAA